jgi:hypothetical protein
VVIPALLLLVLPVLERARGWPRTATAALIAASVAVQLPLVTLNVSYYYALEAAENERAGLPPESNPTPLVWRSWPLAAQVVGGALTQPEVVKSIPPRGEPGMSGEELLASVRSFYVPYFWWALAYFYDLAPPGLVWVGAILVPALAALSWWRLIRRWPRPREASQS